jgi:hypothetical protein
MSNRRARSSHTVEQISRQRQKPTGNLGQSGIRHKLDGRRVSSIGVELSYEGLETQLRADVLDDEPMAR